jgi:predicted nucleotidyltransferase
MFPLNVPNNVKGFLTGFVQAIQQQLTGNLIGIYLHGSLAMGSFNATSSDIDLLIVVSQELDHVQKTALVQLLLQFSQ